MEVNILNLVDSHTRDLQKIITEICSNLTNEQAIIFTTILRSKLDKISLGEKE